MTDHLAQMATLKPSITANWIDAVISGGVDPRDLPEELQDLCKHVFDFGGECGRLEIEAGMARSQEGE